MQEEFHDDLHERETKTRSAPPTIEGLPVDEFIARNADPIWLLENGYYEFLDTDEA